MSYGEPDFSQFTREELVYVLLRVDREKYPERVESIETLLKLGVHPEKVKTEVDVTFTEEVCAELGMDFLFSMIS